jgi:ATP-dependent DNA helicase RecQ
MARKRAALIHLLEPEQSRPAIVYCGTRRDTETVAELIAANGITAGTYHAGMSPGAREESQRAFMEGSTEVIVATNAFGMGVDKADVRTVVHWALPTSLESYYQEAGRAGRDGLPARALLLAARVDLGRLIRFIKERETTVEDVKRFVGALRSRSDDGTVMLQHGELDERSRVLLSIAERAGAAELAPGGRGGLLVTLTGTGSTREAQLAIRAAKNRVWDAYHSIERYSSASGVCRRRQILEHFGDHPGGNSRGRCCDVCDPDPALREAVEAGPVSGRSSSRSAHAAHAGRARRATGIARGPETLSGIEDEDPVDESQFDALRAWRLARAEGKPAYTVATDSALRGVLRRRPTAITEVIEVRGLGKAFCENHGDSLLELLGSWELG